MIVSRMTLLICLLTAGLALPASGEELVVATFGGTFVENSKKCHAAPFEKATGAGVKYVLGSYFYWALMSVAAWKALFQLIFRPHYWEKTQHGLNARSAAAVKGAGSE